MGPRIIANEQIRSDTVRLSTDNGSEIIAKKEAIQKARTEKMDLIMISDKTDPPVCKIMDKGKYVYDIKQRAKEAKKKQREAKVETKEIRLGINIENNDVMTKAKQAMKFIEKGAVVNLVIILKGRERSKGDRAIELLNTFAEQCNSELEQINRAGNRISARIKNV